MTRISAGAVLARSLSIWLRNLAPFLLLTLLITFPEHLLRFAIQAGRFSFDDELLDSAVPQLVGGALLYVANGAICWGAFQQLRGKPIGFVRCITEGLKRLPRVLAVGVVTGIVVGIGLVLILPGLVLLSVLYVVIPAAVIERGGVAASMQRSAMLTAGHRLAVFGIVLLMFALAVGAVLLAKALLGENGAGFSTATVVLGVIFGSFGAVTATVAYHDLRLIKEGASSDDLGDVFE